MALDFKGPSHPTQASYLGAIQSQDIVKMDIANAHIITKPNILVIDFFTKDK